MGTKKTETTATSTIPGASGMSNEIMALLQQMAQSGAGQSGDLSQLAAGQMGASAQDRQLVGQAQEASGDIARSQMEAGLEDALRQLEGGALSRGIEGSSIESVNNALVGRDFQRQLQELLMQQQGQASQQLVNMPFQRAQTQLGANQLLLQRLTGAGGGALNFNLQERLAQGTQRGTSETSGMTTGEALGAGAQFARRDK